MAQTNAPAPTKVITGLVRFSYAHVWNPTRMEGSTTDKYSVSLIIPKTDKETLAKIEAAIKAAEEQFKLKNGGKIPANFKRPLRDGGVERPDDESYKGAFFVNASSNTKPGIVDKNAQPILDQSEFYSGCFGRASVNFYPFNVSGSKGVACGLNNVQKVKDGEALGGKTRAEDDFEAVAGDDDDLV